MKTETSSLDLYYLLKEMSFLKGGKVDKLYQDKKNLLLQIHVTSKGRQLLNIISPEYFYLSSKKPEFPQTPGGFCTFLRKYLHNSKIKSLRQIGFERIIEMEFEGKLGTYLLVIELFSKGNIILCKKDYSIMSAVESKNWGARTIRGGIKYEFPKKEYNILEMTKEELSKALSKTGKESIVKTLAIDFSFGGTYAEEICALSGTQKDRKPSKDMAEKLHDTISRMLSIKLSPVLTNEEALPFNLKSKKPEGKPYETFNEAIDSIITPKLISRKSEETLSKHQKKIEKAEEIIKRQQRQIESMQKSHDDYTRTGELIYEKYTEIKEILEKINEAKNKFSWKEIKAKLKGHKTIKNIDEKESKVTIEID